MLEQFGDARVFAIDDNNTNLELLNALLTRAGLRTVYTSNDPIDALSRLDEIDPDLILLDLHMPQLDGYTVLSRLAIRAAGAYLPVLVLTADATPEATKRALDLGARDFVTKPFDATEVILRVRNLLETRYLYQTLRSNNITLRNQIKDFEELERAESEAWQLERETIENVIRRNAIEMVFQPVFDLESRTIVGAEALARFPGKSDYSPDRWFTTAASVGLGYDLEVAAIGAALPALGILPKSAFLAVNVSPATLVQPDFLRLFSPDICPRLVLELTEHIQIEDYGVISPVVGVFRERGARLAADDVGAGYAGFRHLLGVNPDIIKLDISLIRGINLDPSRRALATALVSFALETGRKLIAEGVETEEEQEVLKHLKVDWGQGFGLARPKPIGHLEALFA